MRMKSYKNICYLEIRIKEGLEKQQEAISTIRAGFEKLKQNLEEDKKKKAEKEKLIAALEMQIQELRKVEGKISSLDVCPLCKTKMTKEKVAVIKTRPKEVLAHIDKLLSLTGIDKLFEKVGQGDCGKG